MKIEVIFFCLFLSLASCKGQEAKEPARQEAEQEIEEQNVPELYDDKEYINDLTKKIAYGLE